MMVDLMSNRAYQHYITDKATNRLIEDDERKQKVHDVVDEAIEGLVAILDLAVEYFDRAASLQLFNFSSTMNRDSSTFVSIRLVLDRVMNDGFSSVEQLISVCRRLTQLCRLFAIRMSSTIPVVQCALTSSILCDMLYQLEHCLDNWRPQMDNSHLAMAIDNFNKSVVRCLNELVIEWQDEQYNNQSIKVKACRTKKKTFIRLAPSRQKLTAGGYLLPFSLQQSRNAIGMTTKTQKRKSSIDTKSIMGKVGEKAVEIAVEKRKS